MFVVFMKGLSLYSISTVFFHVCMYVCDYGHNVCNVYNQVGVREGGILILSG